MQENGGLPNVAAFTRQAEIFRQMLEKAGPGEKQDQDPAFSLPLGEMFSIVVYAQLILEQVKIAKVDQDVVNQMFDFVVRDFAHFALQIYDNHSTQETQRAYCKDIMLIRAVPDHEQYTRLWERYVAALNGEYAMNP